MTTRAARPGEVDGVDYFFVDEDAFDRMVAENRLDGLGAMSVGARTHASSYIEGPARLMFLAETFGRDLPKKLLIGYYTNSLGLLDQLEELTGYPLATLEQLYRRWLREHLWGEHLSTGIPDTLGTILMAKGERERGLELLGHAAELAPEAHQIRLNFAKALIQADRKAAARKELEPLAKLDSRLPVQQEAAKLLGAL